MSSACVCHIEGDFCFYCEIYGPLERKHEIQTGAIERVIAELEELKKTAYEMQRNSDHPYDFKAWAWGEEVGLEKSIDKLKEVLNTETNNSNSPNGNGPHDSRDGQTD